MSQIVVKTDTVIRPASPWSRSVHICLKFLEQQGFQGIPKVLALDNDNETLSLVKGKTFNYPLLEEIASLQALETAARLQRRLHDASVGFIEQYDVARLDWMLSSDTESEVMCHGDFAPYNVALEANNVVGVFDFDTVHPGSRLWDLSYSVYCWAPFKTNSVDKLGDIEQQVGRAKAYLDVYEIDTASRLKLVETMVSRLRYLVSFMEDKADKGDQGMQQCIEEGHRRSYLNDIDYLLRNSDVITGGIQ
ncbi:aminoglycoside phosphotransferase family protein [Vibrio mediterranei]|uniref:phosphotransferase enzyme family protein n=1 Tax=Vibrio mediterranei TaxID=689 RepID=UPI001EFC36C1|nr:aminoglycoside phosphotransferase family protein [Vibrio mediterranei]MCG9628042.1 aminoglycoside phosphotransferase family protein [Vibrio mediterranei]